MEDLKQLLEKYNAGMASREDVRNIEQAIEAGLIDLTAIESLQYFEKNMTKMEAPVPSLALDDKFYQMLSREKSHRETFSWKSFFAWPQLAPKLALASVTLMLGLALGYFVFMPQQNDQQIEKLVGEVSDLKEMMMLTLLEKESATERLKAVSLSQEMSHSSKKVTDALLKTLNKDENVNVRLAALDALRAYGKDGRVREALIRSIANQDSPLVQIALAELMADLQAKSSVKELEKILQDDKTPKDVKNRIKETIEILI